MLGLDAWVFSLHLLTCSSLVFHLRTQQPNLLLRGATGLLLIQMLVLNQEFLLNHRLFLLPGGYIPTLETKQRECWKSCYSRLNLEFDSRVHGQPSYRWSSLSSSSVDLYFWSLDKEVLLEMNKALRTRELNDRSSGSLDTSLSLCKWIVIGSQVNDEGIVRDKDERWVQRCDWLKEILKLEEI